MLTFGRTMIWVAAGTIGASCSPKQPCMVAGDGGLFVPESRVGAIANIRSSNRCDVFAPVEGCDAGGCFERGDAGLGQWYRVTAVQPGSCTVTVTFSDGCEPEDFEFTFGGPLGNCCSEACARGGGEEVRPSCELDAGP